MTDEVTAQDADTVSKRIAKDATSMVFITFARYEYYMHAKPLERFRILMKVIGIVLYNLEKQQDYEIDKIKRVEEYLDRLRKIVKQEVEGRGKIDLALMSDLEMEMSELFKPLEAATAPRPG